MFCTTRAAGKHGLKQRAGLTTFVHHGLRKALGAFSAPAARIGLMSRGIKTITKTRRPLKGGAED
jgi:hypothetical protein